MERARSILNPKLLLVIWVIWDTSDFFVEHKTSSMCFVTETPILFYLFVSKISLALSPQIWEENSLSYALTIFAPIAPKSALRSQRIARQRIIKRSCREANRDHRRNGLRGEMFCHCHRDWFRFARSERQWNLSHLIESIAKILPTVRWIYLVCLTTKSVFISLSGA
jgi:hypothetical protein